MTSVSVSPLARVNKHKRDWRGWKFMWPFALVFVFIVPIFAVCCLFPFVSMLINATKTQSDFTGAFGLGFGKTFALWDNIVTVFTYDDGIFARWLVNTLIYVVVGASGATLLAIMGGYALAKFRFPGRKAVSAVIIGSISVPGIALAALFTIVATWNDCFLPLIMLKNPDWFPLTIGLNQWKDQASTAGGQAIQNLVITVSLITIIPAGHRVLVPAEVLAVRLRRRRRQGVISREGQCPLAACVTFV